MHGRLRLLGTRTGSGLPYGPGAGVNARRGALPGPRKKAGDRALGSLACCSRDSTDSPPPPRWGGLTVGTQRPAAVEQLRAVGSGMRWVRVRWSGEPGQDAVGTLLALLLPLGCAGLCGLLS